MGLEDYTIQLRPTSKTDPDISKIEHTLGFLKFQKLASTPIIGGACLAEPPQDETYFLLCTETYIVEAKLKTFLDTPQSLRYISLRFALGQPMKVVEDFQEIVCDLAHRFNMSIYDADEEYTCQGLPCAFCSALDERIRARKAQWHAMFPGVSEKPCLPVAQAWHYFLNEQKVLQSQAPEHDVRTLVA
jgi:hypothetical protein